MKCTACQIETSNPKFCSRKCSTAHNNKLLPKRKLTKECFDCPTLVRSNRKYCKECLQKFYRLDTTSTLEVLLNQTKKYNTLRCTLRRLARKKAQKHGMLKRCAKCDYNIYIETCHIKPVSSFPLTALVSEVNDIHNLIGLCPNHHKELDLGFLTL